MRYFGAVVLETHLNVVKMMVKCTIKIQSIMVQSFLVGLTFRRNNITRCIKLDLTTCNLSHLEYTLSLSMLICKCFLT